MKSGTGIIDGYQQIANAIVEQAAKDYRWALRRLKKVPEDDNAEKMRKDCERFFKSGWIMELTSVNGVWLMEKLAKEVKCGK